MDAPGTLAELLDALKHTPSRTGSVIITVYGDAIAPRGGEIALANLLELMRALGAGDGMVRTAVSRLTKDGWLERQRVWRGSFYRLSRRGEGEFHSAVPRIYGPLDRAWAGQLRLAFAEAGPERSLMELAGYTLLAPGVLVGLDSALTPPGQIPSVLAHGEAASMRAIAARAWPLTAVADGYRGFMALFAAIEGSALPPLEALGLRILLIHEYRRVVLRDPHLPAVLLPPDWPGLPARTLCATLYAALAPASEAWLDGAECGSGPLPRGPDPLLRFSGGGR